MLGNDDVDFIWPNRSLSLSICAHHTDLTGLLYKKTSIGFFPLQFIPPYADKSSHASMTF